jgi:hypothetical protein
VLSRNSAGYGAGAYGCAIEACGVSNNTASYHGGGAAYTAARDSAIGGNTATNDGGGLYGSVVSGCTISDNRALRDGGGARGCHLTNSVIRDNTATRDGGGAWGGTYAPSALAACTLAGNSVYGAGGGACGAALSSCLVTGNWAQIAGGGVHGGMANNSTVCGNWTYGDGGGLSGSTGNNSVVYYNAATGAGPNVWNTLCRRCCTVPDPAPAGAGNFTNAPGFVNYAAGNCLLTSTSPCVNVGDNAYATEPTDRDGNARIRASVVDVGAFESPYAVVVASAGPHGSISPSGRVVAVEFSSPSFVIAPDPGWVAIREVKVDGSSVGATNRYTFAAIATNHTIEALFMAYPGTNGYPITGLSPAPTQSVSLSWVATNGWRYTLQTTPRMVPAAWASVPPFTNMAGAGTLTITFPSGGATQAFYRLTAAESP